MTNEPAQSGASTPDAPQFSRFGTKGLEGYLAANRSKFTEDALRDAAIASGWDASIVETTLGAVRDAERGVVVSIPSARYKVIIWIVRRLPQGVTRWIARKISSTRSEAQRETVGAQ